MTKQYTYRPTTITLGGTIACSGTHSSEGNVIDWVSNGSWAVRLDMLKPAALKMLGEMDKWTAFHSPARVRELMPASKPVTQPMSELALDTAWEFKNNLNKKRPLRQVITSAGCFDYDYLDFVLQIGADSFSHAPAKPLLLWKGDECVAILMPIVAMAKRGISKKQIRHDMFRLKGADDITDAIRWNLARDARDEQQEDIQPEVLATVVTSDCSHNRVQFVKRGEYACRDCKQHVA